MAWIFSEDGYLSIVEYNPPATHYDRDQKKMVPFKDGVVEKLPNYVAADSQTLSSHLLVRARVKEDFNVLKTYDPQHVETEDKTADYQFRLVILRTAVATYFYDKMMLLDYTSHVKETVNSRAPQIPGGRMGAMSAIWSATARWQPLAPWGNEVSYGGYGPAGGTGTSKSYSSSERWNRAEGYWEKWDSVKRQYVKSVHAQTSGSLPIGGGGTANPKVLPAGKSEKEDERPVGDALDQAFEELDRQKALEEADKDSPTSDWRYDPESDGWVDAEWTDVDPEDALTEEYRVIAPATRLTMVDQVKKVAKDRGQSVEAEAMVDELEDTHGTCNIDSIPADVIDDLLDNYSTVSNALQKMGSTL